MTSVVDLKTKEEKDAELDKRIEALRKKNESLMRRYQEIEEDRKKAEQEGIAVTAQRKPKHTDPEPERRKEKDQFTITVDVSNAASDKRVVSDRKHSTPRTSPRSPVQQQRQSPQRRTSGRFMQKVPVRSPHENSFDGHSLGSPEDGSMSRQEQMPHVERGSRSPQDGPKRGGFNQSERMQRGGKVDQPVWGSLGGENLNWLDRNNRGRRGQGRGGGGGGGAGGGRGIGRGGGDDRGIPHGVSISGPDRKIKDWEEKRRQNIEKMNEEMEKIAEYERSQRDGCMEKNPFRNFLDDPRRSGPLPDGDRKEGSRRHTRNWGGPDFEKVKTGMEREKEWHGRRPVQSKSFDMTLSMTGRERTEYMQWKKEREQIDQERLARHRNATGQWRREWDLEKTENTSANTVELPLSDQGDRQEDYRRPPKPATFGDFIPERKSRGSGRFRGQGRGRGQSKSYSMHDNRWEEKPMEENIQIVEDRQEQQEQDALQENKQVSTTCY
ncbi:coiled-coil domain-containing protein 9-like isoform X2 [Protopterus annectens]|uniref:coiled-coil domain-containing protein 9-like isoform X2 n=1 Tax=Protopterus annectens TaxID=7888 RepID=UPI001CFBAF49|nr:coiled-coil domain-containing protein 9-like isoform X2 [Protopterus annectens]